MNVKNKILSEVLPYIKNPAKYIGSELNSIVKKHSQVKIKFALAFPDTYEIGMSHLGSKIIYSIINQHKDFLCERVFSPWIDMENRLRKKNIPLYSLETFTPIKNFDIVGFSIQHELCYTNILNLLELSRIPLYSSSRRGKKYPLIIGGGPLAFSPEPLADFIDGFIIGDAEEVILEFLAAYAHHQEKKGSKKEFLLHAARTIKGVYVPSLYKTTYGRSGKIESITPQKTKLPKKIRKRITRLNRNLLTKNYIVPLTKIVHDRIVLEIMRGCGQGCRFCQAGIIYRPQREKNINLVFKQAVELLKSTGYEEISLASLSSTDYAKINELVEILFKELQQSKIAISLPSLRADRISSPILSLIKEIKKTGITIAPEAGSQRLRELINKKITREDILESATKAYRHGWKLIKLYFMIGLPTETNQDLDEMIDLIYEISNARTDSSFGKGTVNVTIAFFIPKAHTPLQWERISSLEEMYNKKEYIYSRIKSKRIRLKFHNYKTSFLEAFFAKGDRRLGKVLYSAFKKGAKFDNWTEFFNFETWRESLQEINTTTEEYLNLYTKAEEILPWEHIDPGIKKEFLLREYQRAKNFKQTPSCREECLKCGVCG